MKNRLLLILLALGLGTGGLAQADSELPHLALVGQSGSKSPIDRDKLVFLVVEGPFLSYEKNPIPEGGVVEYVNTLLKNKNVSYVGVYGREGVKYGDVVRALDVLRKTNAKDIGVSMVELPAGRNP